MKNLILFLLAITMLTACKTRQVATRQTDSTSVNQSALLANVTVETTDTSKTTKATSLVQQRVIDLVDSNGTHTVIKPVPGTQSTVDADGSFHGQAESIDVTRHDKTQSKTTINSDLQEKQGEIKGIASTYNSKTTATTNNSTHVKTNTKQTTSKPSGKFYLWICVVLVLLCFGVVMVLKFIP